MLDLIKPSLARFAASLHPEPPVHLGRRYNSAGVFQPEPGNTVVCHLVKGSESEGSVIAVRDRMLAMPDAGQLAFTPRLQPAHDAVSGHYRISPPPVLLAG